MRGLVLLLLTAPALAQDDAWAKLDQEEFARLFRELEELEDHQWRTRAVELERRFSGRETAVPNGAKTEVHGVGVVQVAGRGRGGRPPTVKVRVTRTGCGVVLVLNCRQPVGWRVELADGVRVERVLLAGPERSTVQGVEPEQVRHLRAPFAPGHHGARFEGLQRAVVRVPGVDPMATFQGLPRAPAGGIEVGPGEPAWRRQMALTGLRRLHEEAMRDSQHNRLRAYTRFVFPAAVFLGGSRVFADCTVGGPLADSLVPAPQTAFTTAFDADRGRCYSLGSRRIEVLDERGRELEPIELPQWAGPRSFILSIAFDGRRRRLVVCSWDGSMGAYSIDEPGWTHLRRAGGVRVGQRQHGLPIAITYDAQRDGFWMLCVGGRTHALVPTDAFGQAMDAVTVKFPERIRLGVRTGSSLHVIGEHLAFITLDASPGRPWTQSCFVLDPATGRVLLDEPFRPQRVLPPRPRTEWPGLWSELGSADAYSAMRFVERADEEFVAYLRERWDALPELDDEEVDGALEDLASPEAVLRRRGVDTLMRGGPRLMPRLAAELERQDSAEVRFCLSRILARYEARPDRRGRLLRALRDVRVPGAAELRARLRAE